MKKTHQQHGIIISLTAFAMLIAAHTPAWAEDAGKTLLGGFLKEKGIEVTGSATMDVYDKYVWRGQYLDKDTVLQPGVSFSAKGFTVGYWSSFDMENQDALLSDESDYYASYTHGVGPVNLTVGHTWYDFPETNTSSKEVYVTAALNTFLAPTISVMHDYEDGKNLNTDKDGNYYVFSLSHSLPLSQNYGAALDLQASVGYVDGQWLSGEGWHITPTAGLKLPLTANLTMTPFVGYNAPFGDLEDPAIGNQKDKVFGGIKTTCTF